MLIGVPPSCHFKLTWMLFCLTICAGACVVCYSPSSGVTVYAAKVRVSPVASQGGAVSTKFLQWHSSVWMFQICFPVVFQCILQVIAGSPSGIPVYTGWSTSSIPVCTGPASVHWLRVRDMIMLPPPCHVHGGQSQFKYSCVIYMPTGGCICWCPSCSSSESYKLHAGTTLFYILFNIYKYLGCYKPIRTPGFHTRVISLYITLQRMMI